MTHWLLLYFAHFVGDFVLQSDWQSRNKWHSWPALSSHVAIYTLVIGAWAFLVVAGKQMEHPFTWVAVNGFAHLAVDSVTAQWTHHYYGTKEWHKFFIVVGFDQWIHYATLSATWFWLAA